MTTSISSSVLLAYFQARDGQTTANLAAGTSAKLAASAPSAPWNTSTTATKTTPASTSPSASTSANTLVQQILGGKPVVAPSPSALSLTSSNAAANTDYENLFALYQGLTSLQSLATAAGQSGVASTQLALIQKAFASGLSQVRGFVSSGPFKEFAVSEGTIATSDETTVGAQQSTDTYDTSALANSASAVLPALQGAVAFSLTATNVQGKATTVNFNLADMGSTPRTLSNVVSYLNGQLQAAGLHTRFADNLTPGQPAVTTTNSSGVVSVVTAATPNQYGLQINGTPNELLSFSAAGATPSVYVAQTSFDPNQTSTTSTTSTTTTTSLSTSTSTSGSTTTAPALTSAFLKFEQPAAAGGATLRGFTDNLPSGSVVKATATAPDGSVYVLANVTSTTAGQTLQGTQDAALFKYDSAGQLIYTQTLGAADTANATALAVSADGSQVAIAGSITGSTLDPTDTSQAGSTTAQSFVTVYDAAGEELWNKTQAATADNQVNAVSFGPNNSVYVAGSTSGRLTGATAFGGQDGYLQGFSASAVKDKYTGVTTWTASTQFTQQFGTSGVDRATGVAVSGSSVYVSSVENGDAVVRRYDVASTTNTTTSTSGATSTTTSTQATLGALQDLGGVDGGDVSGVAIAPDGSVVVAGSTHNAGLNAGTINAAYSGNGDAFVADLNANLDPTGAESLSYYNAGGPTTASAITLSGGDAYITGQIAGASIYTPSKGYAAALNLASGATDWSTTFTGNNGSAAPASIAVSAGGASVLDLLGLPQGALQVQNQPSTLLTANSSVRAGDSFYIQNGAGLPQKVTIEATDTYSTLASKIAQASGYNATATTLVIGGQQQLKIAPATPSASIRIEAGPAGQDALGSLGLKEGLLTSTANTLTPVVVNGTAPTSNIKTHYQITIPDTLSLASTTSLSATQQSLSVAIAEVKSIYTDMTSAKTSPTGATTGTVPAYLTAQIANYKLALSRLTGSSG